MISLSKDSGKCDKLPVRWEAQTHLATSFFLIAVLNLNSGCRATLGCKREPQLHFLILLNQTLHYLIIGSITPGLKMSHQPPVCVNAEQTQELVITSNPSIYPNNNITICNWGLQLGLQVIVVKPSPTNNRCSWTLLVIGKIDIPPTPQRLYNQIETWIHT